ncbi:MAG: hypothetical protein RL885_25790 [Planctomycetota bacterium]
MSARPEARLVLENPRLIPRIPGLLGTLALLVTFQAVSTAQEEGPGTQSRVQYNRYRATIDGLIEPRAIAIDEDGVIWITQKNGLDAFDRDGEPQESNDELTDAVGIDFASGVPILSRLTFGPQLDLGERTIASSLGIGPGELSRPGKVAAHGNRIAMADEGNRRVIVFDVRPESRPLDLGPELSERETLLRPVDVAFDEEGRLYVLDQDAGRIHRFSTEGLLEASFGATGAYPGLMSSPSGLACSEGRVFVADTWNHRVQVFDSAGKWQWEWGLHALRPREGEGHLHYPADIAISPDGSFAVVLEPFEGRAQIFDRKTDPAEIRRREEQALFGTGGVPHYGQAAAAMEQTLAIIEPETQSVLIFDTGTWDPILISKLGGYGTGPGQFVRPTGIAFHRESQRLFITDATTGRLQVFRVARDLEAELGFDPWLASLEKSLDLEALRESAPWVGAMWHVEPRAVAVGESGRTYVADAANGVIWILSPKLALIDYWPGFDRPRLVAVDEGAKRAYIGEEDRAAFLLVDLESDAIRDWPEPLGESELEQPSGIALTSDGRALVTDAALDQVLVYSPRGRLLSTWGGTGLGAGQFRRPQAIVSERAGRFTVIDWGNHRGQMLSEDGGFLRSFGPVAFVEPTWPEGRKPFPFPPPEDAIRTTTEDGRYEIAYRLASEEIPLNEDFQIEVWVFDSGIPGPALRSDRITLTVDGGMPEHQHGMNQVPEITARPDGSFLVEGMLFHMLGRWELTFDVTEGPRTSRSRIRVSLQ